MKVGISFNVFHCDPHLFHSTVFNYLSESYVEKQSRSNYASKPSQSLIGLYCVLFSPANCGIVIGLTISVVCSYLLL